MSENAHPVPSDIETLHALLAAARAERDAALAERDHALSQIDRLRHLLRQLQRAQFGKRSEKLDPEQLLLALEDIEQAIAGAPIASEALVRIAAIYAIEKTIRGRSADERRAVRQEKSRPLVLELKTWFAQQLAHVSRKSPVADAIRYAQHHWEGLTRFLDDGPIELDTNVVERSIRPVVLNRKNALFAGHDQGAENWACIASLIESCKLLGVDPQTYFTDVLTKLVNLWPASRIDELVPWAWTAEKSYSLAA